MKLAVCIIHNRDRNQMMSELVRDGFKFTVFNSAGGFLQEGNTTLLIGIEPEKWDELKALIEKNCQSREQVVSVMPFESGPPGAYMSSPVKVPIGGAVVFLVDAEQFFRV